MIKINFALRKQAAAIEAKEGKGGGGLAGFKLDAELLKNPQLRKIALGIVVAILANTLIDNYEDDLMRQQTVKLDAITAQIAKAKADLAKTSGYDKLKGQFDADAELIKTKLSIIQKLVSDRQTPPRILLSLSKSIPAKVWLSDINLSDKELKLKGASLDFEQVTDFMKSMDDNEFLTEMKLVDSQKTKDAHGLNIATFSFEAKRK